MFGRGHDDAIHQNARYPDEPGVQAAGFGDALDLDDDDAARVAGGRGDRQRFKDQRLLLHRDVAVRIGAGAPQDRDIDRTRLVEQVFLAAQRDDLDDILGRTGVDLAAAVARIDEGVGADAGDGARAYRRRCRGTGG